MHRTRPILFRAFQLTGVNLLLRLGGTLFQVYLSRRIGPAGLGMLQLVLSVGSFAAVAGVAGVRTAAMYLAAEELGRNRPQNIAHVLSGCFRYSLLCSTAAGLGLWLLGPWLAENWLGSPDTLPALRLYAAFLPASCFCGVMSGYFTAANRIGTLAAVEVGEQLCAMGITMTLLTLWAGTSPSRACLSVVLGSGIGSCLTLCCLGCLRLREWPAVGAPIPIRERLLEAALPLARADVVRSGISSAENLMVPKRLALYPGEQEPLAAFGIVSGMVFPVMMFPACFLFALAELLIPELARCRAAGNQKRIVRLVERGLRAAVLYGLSCAAVLALLSRPLCLRLYGNTVAGEQLRLYTLMVPFLYCDILVDAMTKGLGQQRICVRYNILTSGLDVLLLFLLLPRLGMLGYFFSFLVSHLLNFILSLRRLVFIVENPSDSESIAEKSAGPNRCCR